MIVRHKTPEPRVLGPMEIVADHPIIIHFEGIAGFFAIVDIDLAVAHDVLTRNQKPKTTTPAPIHIQMAPGRFREYRRFIENLLYQAKNIEKNGRIAKRK